MNELLWQFLRALEEQIPISERQNRPVRIIRTGLMGLSSDITEQLEMTPAFAWRYVENMHQYLDHMEEHTTVRPRGNKCVRVSAPEPFTWTGRLTRWQNGNIVEMSQGSFVSPMNLPTAWRT